MNGNCHQAPHMHESQAPDLASKFEHLVYNDQRAATETR